MKVTNENFHHLEKSYSIYTEIKGMNDEDSLKNKPCEECRYYKFYFKKMCGRFHRTAGMGDCYHPETLAMSRADRARLKLIGTCERWEPYEIQVTERRVGIRETIRHIQKTLDDILAILQDDEDTIKEEHDLRE